MTSPGPAFRECTGSCHENVLAPRAVSSNLRSTDGLSVLARVEIVAILVHYQPLSTHCCLPMSLCTARCILQAKLTSLNTYPFLGSPIVTILSTSPLWMLFHCVVIADLLNSSHPRMSASHLLGLQNSQQNPAFKVKIPRTKN